MFNKIGITGDIHGDLSLKRIKKAIEKGYDLLIVVGDFGYVWDNSKEELKTLEIIENIPITILFIDGNHENFNLLKEYPISKWNGGNVRFIRKNIIHLLRGEVFNINDKKYFTFGGAKSVDRFMRTENVDFWEEEMPNLEEMNKGISNLEINENKVDYVLTHTCSSEMLKKVVNYPEDDDLTRYLQFIKDNIEFNKWYFGHMHLNYNIDDKNICLYDNIIDI